MQCFCAIAETDSSRRKHKGIVFRMMVRLLTGKITAESFGLLFEIGKIVPWSYLGRSWYYFTITLAIWFFPSASVMRSK
jgi:hypothetical protein